MTNNYIHFTLQTFNMEHIAKVRTQAEFNLYNYHNNKLLKRLEVNK